MLPVVNSIKNVVVATDSIGTAVATTDLAKAVSNPVNTVTTDTQHGSIIKAIWLSLDFCGLAATGVLQQTSVFLFKNSGANLTVPSAFAVGSSNEKKYVIKQWQQMTMRNQDGNPPYHWEGWIKIPKRYQRQGTDDVWQIAYECSTAAGHLSLQAIYKWFT